jgi:hypothetical protein
MQKLFNKQVFCSFFLMAIMTLTQAVVMAQDSSVSSTSTTSTTSTSTTNIQPWMWVVGGVIVLIIILALLRGNRSSDSVVVTKERIKE